MKNEYEIKTIDVLDEPQQAEIEKILATPTAIKESPPPIRRTIDALSDTQKVLKGLT